MTSDFGFAPGQGVVLDIESEFSYWRHVFPSSEFDSLSLSFEALVPTIKFGYDCILLVHTEKLAGVLRGLREQHSTTLAVGEQLDWRWADRIIRHAWDRMRVN